MKQHESPDPAEPVTEEPVPPPTRFPVLMDYTERHELPLAPRSVPWGLLAPHEKRAKWNRDQSLWRLASRGGLDPREMLAVIHGRSLRDMLKLKQPLSEAVDELLGLVREYHEKTRVQP